MRERYVAEECRKCIDNNKSLAWCFDCCGIPHDLLDNIEESNKAKERLLEVHNDKSQH